VEWGAEAVGQSFKVSRFQSFTVSGLGFPYRAVQKVKSLCRKQRLLLFTTLKLFETLKPAYFTFRKMIARV
jgi:hypothetical protein